MSVATFQITERVWGTGRLSQGPGAATSMEKPQLLLPVRSQWREVAFLSLHFSLCTEDEDVQERSPRNKGCQC